MARNSLLCADVPLRNYSLTPQRSVGYTSANCYTCDRYVGMIYVRQLVLWNISDQGRLSASCNKFRQLTGRDADW